MLSKVKIIIIFLSSIVGFALFSNRANADECYFIKNVETTLYLDAVDTNLFTYPGNGGVTQKWSLLRTNGSEGPMYLISVDSKKALDGAHTPFPNAFNWGDSQKWILTQVDKIPYLNYIKHFKTGNALDSNNNRQVYFNPLYPNLNQAWLFQPTSCR